MDQRHSRPQWGSVCCGRVEVERINKKIQPPIRATLCHYTFQCGTKGCECLARLLSLLSRALEIAFVSVWSSMKKTIVEEIYKYLFRGGQMPVCVLGQDSCKTVKCRDTSGRLVSFKELGTYKDLFLKNLESLFSSSKGNFSCNNTVIVDDSPRKHIMNKPENVVLPDAWSNRGNGEKDSFLLNVLLPYFRRLHTNQDVGLKSFQTSGPGRIGWRMLCEERNRREFEKLMEVVRGSTSVC